MMSASQLALVRAAAPAIRIPGLDIPVGSPVASTASLKAVGGISTNSTSPVWYDALHKTVHISVAGAVLDGYDLRGVSVVVAANNATIRNCVFDAAAGYYTIRQLPGVGGMVVDHNTFDGGKVDRPLSDFVAAGAGKATITNNIFLNAPSDAVQISNGVVSGNYFSGGGYQTGAHADAIWVGATTGPVDISNNLIDWTANADAKAGPNNAIRITNETGPTNNVLVHNNILLGGNYTVSAVANPALPNAFANVSVVDNLIGFGTTGAIYPGAGAAAQTAGNNVFDFTNRAYSDRAWTAYQSAGIRTDHLVVEPAAGGTNLAADKAGTTTLYGGGLAEHMYGGANSTVFVGGFGTQYLVGGAGVDYFTYLSVADSTPHARDVVIDFDDAKDAIDLHLIDAAPAVAGLQNFRFIGSSAFSLAGGEVGYTLDAARNRTYVDATLAGDATADLHLEIVGLHNLTAANFILAKPTLSSAVSAVLPFNMDNVTLVGAANADAAGNGADNVVTGNSGDNQLFGLGGADSLFGGAGADSLDGGAGADRLTGGAGNDLFVFHKGEARGDVVADFSGAGAAVGDRLAFYGYGAGAIQRIGASDSYSIIPDAAHGGVAGAETIRLVNVFNLNTAVGGNDFKFF